MNDTSPALIQHRSVLLAETIAALCPSPGKVYVDCTLGGGGHSLALAARLDQSNTLIGLDQDPIALSQAAERFVGLQPAFQGVTGNFGELPALLFQAGWLKINGGLMADLGMSAFQLKDPARGFSFQYDGPLDMRMSPQAAHSAADILNTWDERELANMLYRGGDEKLSRPLAKAIVAGRPWERTKPLAQLCEQIYHRFKIKSYGTHPATRTFQALRIAVNQELEALEKLLDALPAVLEPGARVALISFHSIEDRIIKHYFRQNTAVCLCPPRQPVCTCTHTPAFKLIGKPITASESEIADNPESRSATLRVAERL